MTLPRVLTWTVTLCTALLVAWALLSKVSDADTWWHIRAGQTMLRSGWITLDPFAYTRESLPYLATHEWLYQLVTAAVWNAGGANALIILRILTGLATAGVLLRIDRKNLFPNVLLAGIAIIVTMQDFVERPQLFTNLFFAISVVLCLKLPDLPREQWKKILIQLFIVTVVWANMHGGAAILSPLLLGTVLTGEMIRKKNIRDTRVIVLAVSIVLLILALLITPNHLHNITYLHLLLTDKTSALLNEWTPSSWDNYLLWIGPFWIAAVVSTVAAGRNVVTTALMLLGIGYLSRSGARHEVLFVLLATGVTFDQLKHLDAWERASARLRHHLITASIVAAAGLLLMLSIDLRYQNFFARRNLAGFGAFSPVTGAADFLEKNAVPGPLFNTYTAGGYLLFRGQKVFVDGRNVDYGYDFLKPAFDARYSRQIFTDLAQTYGFTAAVIERRTQDGAADDTFAFLPALADWGLAYADDWTAVYLRRVPANDAHLAARAYHVLTVAMLDTGTLPENLTQQGGARLERELRRASQEDTRGIRAAILLAKLYRATGNFDQAIVIANGAMTRAPSRHEPHEILGSIAAVQERWEEAADHYERVLALSKHLNITPPYGQLAIIFENAGRHDEAEAFRKQANPR